MTIIQQFSRIIRSVACKEQVQDVEISLRRESTSTDGYMGKIHFLQLKGSNKILQVALKVAAENEQVRQITMAEILFKNEIFFYSQLEPIFAEIQKNAKEPFSVPKCYHSSLEKYKEHLMLNDMSYLGYEMWDRMKMMDLEHITFIIKQYAKLHSLSYVLKETDVESFNLINKNVINTTLGYISFEENVNALRSLLLSFMNAVPETFENEDLKMKFNDLIENFPIYYQQVSEMNKDLVLNHGDCWSNNMMFKYKDGKLIDMKLLDFQMIKLANPVMELSHLIYTCTSRQIYEDISALLRIYHEALKEHGRNLGVEIKLTFEELENYWKTYAKLGLFAAFIALKLVLADDSEDIPDVGKTSDKGGQIAEALNFQGKHDAEYFRRLNDIVLHCYENGFL